MSVHNRPSSNKTSMGAPLSSQPATQTKQPLPQDLSVTSQSGSVSDSFSSLTSTLGQAFRTGASLLRGAMPSSSVLSSRPLMQSGATGPEVRQLQVLLEGTGHNPGKVDGDFGPKTKSAVKDFQRAHGLTPDGIVGPKTWEALSQAVKGSSAPNQGPTQPQTPSTPNIPIPAGPVGPTGPAAPAAPINNAQLIQTLANSAASAQAEWQAGVREVPPGSNRSARIDEYAKNGGFSPSKAPAWCGLFAAFNYSQNGFKHASSLASQQKARDFFMYRSYTKKTNDPAHAQLDQLREQQKAQGSSREYFMLTESPDRRRIQQNPSRYGHMDVDKSTFTFDKLPIQPGDTVLFNHGHVGMVSSYDPNSGKLVTIEGNTSGMGPDGKQRQQAVVKKTYDLSDPAVRAKFGGFGRPAAGDFENKAP